MSSIFISHSSRDNRTATEISEWLGEKGHRSVFLDFDPANGIPAGRDWEKELYRNIRTCRAMIALCSEQWMASRWCFMELTYARALGKQIFPLRVDAAGFDGLITESQIVDFRTNKPEAFTRLWNGLLAAGLDPAEAFDWDGSRSVYPGLLAFQEEDAAVFFGRDEEIGEGLDLLNKCHRLGDTRLVLVLGASGSGKSSLVRAGMLPRLRRDVRRWLVLDPFRPRDDPAGEMAAVLSRAFARVGQSRSVEALRQALIESGQALQPPAVVPPAAGEESPAFDAFLEALATAEARVPHVLGQGAAQTLRSLRASAIRARSRTSIPSPGSGAADETGSALDTLLTTLRRTAESSEANVLITIDQFEELLGHPENHPSTCFLRALRTTVARGGPLIVLATMRSDFLGNFQQATALSGLRYESLSLGSMSPEDVAQVIERPAELQAIALGPGLVQALVDDARAQDALPLLAFTLHELAERYSRDGQIDLEEYRSGLGGMQAAVAKAAEETIAGDHPTAAQTEDLRRAFLRMVRITDDGTHSRRVARWSDLPSGVYPLLEKFVAARLLVSRDEGQGRLVEVAHEALFKSWARLADWLKDSAAALRLREQINAAARSWDEAKRPTDDLWRGGRLVRARELRDRGDIPLEPGERTFVDASVTAEETRVAVEHRRRRRRTAGLAAAAIVGIVLSVIAGVSAWMARRAQAEAVVAARAAEEREREANISAARARAAQNFAEHQRVRARIQASPPGSFQARALEALAPKYLEQSKSHLADATKLQESLAQWQRQTGAAPPPVEAILSLEILQARNSGSSLLLHYGAPAAPRLMLVDGGDTQDHARPLKPRLLALRQQRHGEGTLPIDLVVSSQTDNAQIGGLIGLVEDLAGAPADQRYARIGALWSNAFVPPTDLSPAEIVRHQSKTRLVLGARRLGIPINKPFSKLVSLPEAGSARVHWNEQLSITILGPSLQYVRVFAKGWLNQWMRRVGSKGVSTGDQIDAETQDQEAVGIDSILDDLTLETFSDPTLELIPSPLEIARPEVPGAKDRSYANLGSIVLLVELAGKRVLLPADSRGDLLISALAQAGYTDEHGNVDLDVMAVPHAGSDNNVSVEFFRRVKASHYVFQADGTYTNPELATFKMLFEARRADRQPFTIYLTHLPEQYIKGYPVEALCTLLREERAAGTPFRIVTPQPGQVSLAIHLLHSIPELPAGVEGAACRAGE